MSAGSSFGEVYIVAARVPPVQIWGTRGLSTKTMSHAHLVVLTDGQDNESVQFDKSSICDILQRPGRYAKSNLGSSDGSIFTKFHTTCISVGGGVAASNFEFLESLRKPNLRHVRASDARQIRDCFQEVKVQIESIRVTTRQFKAVIEDKVTCHRISGGGGGRVQSIFESKSKKKGGRGGTDPTAYSASKLCASYFTTGKCNYGNGCKFVHVK